MSTPARGLARVARAGLLAGLTVLISWGGHAVAGGAVHVSLPMLLGGAALGALCVAAADVRRSFPEILAVVVVAQPVLHLLASMGGHGSHGGGSHGGIGMVLAHGGAAVLVSALLADAERAVWTLAGLLAPFRLPTPVRMPIDTPVVVTTRDTARAPLRSTWVASGLFSRGPPVVARAH